MTPKEKAQELIDNFRVILMSEDTDCGNEILCTLIAKQCALVAVNEIQNIKSVHVNNVDCDYWEEVRQQIVNL